VRDVLPQGEPGKVSVILTRSRHCKGESSRDMPLG